MNLADELSQNQSLKFQLNGFGGFDRKFIKQILSHNLAGIFNLSSKIDADKQEKIKAYLCTNYPTYRIQLKNEITNSRIYFMQKN